MMLEEFRTEVTDLVKKYVQSQSYELDKIIIKPKKIPDKKGIYKIEVHIK